MLRNVTGPLVRTNRSVGKVGDIFGAFTAHTFHILKPSTFPILVGVFLFSWLLILCLSWHYTPVLPSGSMLIAFISLFLTVFYWFNAVVCENFQGFHTDNVRRGLRLGVILFIVSEVMFFFGFFWGFFHVSINPSTALGDQWPAVGAQVLAPWGLPLLNTVLLLSSGATVTHAHAQILHDAKFRYFLRALLVTAILGVIFLICQMFEYKYGVQFGWRDNAYGTLFFVTTGFHGLHVTIGTLFLLYCWARQKDGRQSKHAHIGFEGAAWYWHFVDVVWLFLFFVVYWWGNTER